MSSYFIKPLLVVLVLAAHQQASAEEPVPSEARLKAAQQVVKPILERLLKEEIAIEAAYARKDEATLTRLAAVAVKGAPGVKSWDPAEYNPYVKCDTAWIDLGLYANALAKELAHPTPTLKKIVRDELADYQRSKSYCQKRLSVSPKDAWQQYSRE